MDEGYCWCDDCGNESLFVTAKCCGSDICIDCGSTNIKSENKGYVPLEGDE